MLFDVNLKLFSRIATFFIHPNMEYILVYCYSKRLTAGRCEFTIIQRDIQQVVVSLLLLNRYFRSPYSIYTRERGILTTIIFFNVLTKCLLDKRLTFRPTSTLRGSFICAFFTFLKRIVTQ